MKENLVVTISREFGSGGHEIGEKLAKELGVPFYDKAIIDEAAKATGFSEEFIAEHEQKYTSSLMFNLAMGTYSRTGELPLHDQIDIVESNIIRDLAAKGSCVIVGRCANYILEDDFECLNIFIYADDTAKIHHVIEKYGIDAKKAEKTVKDVNKSRSKHYSYFTGKVWGNRANYDLMINSGMYSTDGAVALIKYAIELVK